MNYNEFDTDFKTIKSVYLTFKHGYCRSKQIINFGLLITVVLFFISCSADKPSAGFKVSATTAAVGQSITFQNTSSNANYYQWSFGDGTYAITANPSHSYTTGGYYTVQLIAIGDNSSSTYKIQIIVTGTVTIFPGVGAAGMNFNEDWGNVQSLFPSADISSQSDTNLSSIYYYIYNNAGLYGVECTSLSIAPLDTSDYVDEISVFEELINVGDTARYSGYTSKGIGVGENIAMAEQAYGNADTVSGDGGGFVYYYDNLGIQFWTNDKQSTQIEEIDVYPVQSEKGLTVRSKRHFKHFASTSTQIPLIRSKN